jgi:hypothetical protein
MDDKEYHESSDEQFYSCICVWDLEKCSVIYEECVYVFAGVVHDRIGKIESGGHGGRGVLVWLV